MLYTVFLLCDCNVTFLMSWFISFVLCEAVLAASYGDSVLYGIIGCVCAANCCTFPAMFWILDYVYQCLYHSCISYYYWLLYIFFDMCWVYNAQQVTSRRIGYSKFILHSLLHLYNSQSHNYNYCHRQYHNYVFWCSPAVHSIQLNS
jgi:hypothetical protein